MATSFNTILQIRKLRHRELMLDLSNQNTKQRYSLSNRRQKNSSIWGRCIVWGSFRIISPASVATGFVEKTGVLFLATGRNPFGKLLMFNHRRCHSVTHREASPWGRQVSRPACVLEGPTSRSVRSESLRIEGAWTPGPGQAHFKWQLCHPLAMGL